MSTAGYLAVLAKLAEVDASPAAKEAFRAIVQAQLDAELPRRDDRVEFARAQLRARVPRAEICRLLGERFGIGRSQAYRDIGDALNLSQRMGNP